MAHQQNPCPICGGIGEHVGACSEVAALDSAIRRAEAINDEKLAEIIKRRMTKRRKPQ